MVPILTARELPPVVAFYEGLGLQVTADYGDYVLLAADAVEVHLSQWDDHDPLTTANMLYLRVRDASALYDRLRDELAAEGRLYLAPASGITGEHMVELRGLEEAGHPVTRLHEIEVKPWGQQEFAVIDPAGTLVRVGSPTP